MATPTLSLATFASKRFKKKVLDSEEQHKSMEVTENGNDKEVPNKSLALDSKGRKFWGEETSEDSVYAIYLKKINYSFNSDSMYDLTHRLAKDVSLVSYTKSKNTNGDQVDGSPVSTDSDNTAVDRKSEQRSQIQVSAKYES